MKFISTESAPAAIGPYSQGVRFGNLVFLSGQIPLTAEGALVEGDVRAQTEQVLQNIRAVLRAAGASLSHVVKCTVFLADMNDFSVVNEVYGQAFDSHRPARSTVQVARLPRDVRVEIEVIAAVDERE
ncbi:RidA family protein [Ferroacidibacillus organovorans]|uniref:RidA family protein n=1 Tax=Ferroacidibacillus organovorans TaxID=1765683 RepID=A0A162TZC5_9BACL|nr:RidA family protein [Ferroacidibacillus organovorans]KYP81272.1 hypothetical protein AYJ22_07920 [Ferroacidibacillus organovorans]OPG16893.1 RidA family protein [Ferroacidibacillus organovorans]